MNTLEELEDAIESVQINIVDGLNRNIITDRIDRFNPPIKEEFKIQAEEKGVPKSIIDLYSENDGFKLSWFSNPNEGIGGRIHFIDMKAILGDWKEIIYFEDDLKYNEMLQYFHPFDLATDEAQSGFLITPNFVSESIYYNTTGNPELYDLDLDFEGYIEMAKEARGFFYWQIVLLDLQNGRTSVETERFKKHIPEIFNNDTKEYLNFNWNNFVKKYESLRLSKRKA